MKLEGLPGSLHACAVTQIHCKDTASQPLRQPPIALVYHIRSDNAQIMLSVQIMVNWLIAVDRGIMHVYYI